MATIKQTFFQECEEQLSELEAGLLAIERDEAEPDTVNAVFRAVHSIKGGAGAFSLDELVAFAHVFETALDQLRSGTLAASPEVLAILLRAADLLADLVASARDGGQVAPGRAAVLVAELNGLGPDAALPAADSDAGDDMDGLVFQPVRVALDFGAGLAADLAGDDDLSAARAYTIRFKPRPELYAKGNEAALVLRELERLGRLEVSCDASAVPLLDALDPEGAYLDWTLKLETDKGEAAIREAFEFVEWDCE
ncbi:Hpt domain-containing protein, partial [Mesorhizobium sp. KR2-14]|uniref:Hpt domain-containing protein n=1 Tax=Mesorhizobium sp. KR2-14 TaxID=3156610 RepID=UPI0032B606A8